MLFSFLLWGSFRFKEEVQKEYSKCIPFPPASFCVRNLQYTKTIIKTGL